MQTPSTTDKPRNAFDLPDNWEEGKDIEISCWNCGRKLLHNEHLAKAFSRTICDPCSEEYGNATDPADEKVEEDLEIAIPPLYRTTDRERLPFPDQVGDVLAWTYSPGAKGLWITGDTRVGKTRSLCLLLDRLIRRKVQTRAFFHGSFAAELLEVIRSDRNFRRWKTELAAIPLVVIDDLFSEKLTERTEAALFELLDERIAYLRPTLITTQVVAAEAKERFHSTARFEAFFARIKEFFTLVDIGEKQTELFRGGKSASSTSS